MNFKTLSRSLEKPFVCTYIGLWLAIYLSSRFFLVMYSDRGIFMFWPWVALGLAPFTLYAALRTVFAQAAKWYGAVGYFFIYTFLGVFATGYMIVNGDILLSAAFKPQEDLNVRLADVHKVFSRKTGFDHTALTVVTRGRTIEMEARPFAFFYLEGRKEIVVKLGKSSLGNDFVTHVGISSGDKLKARWVHFKDMLYRMRWLWGMIGLFILAMMVIGKYSPERELRKRKPMPLLKMIGLIMGILMGLAMLFYVGVLVWVWVVK